MKEIEKKDIKLEVEQKLQKTSNRIKKSRKNITLAQKEAAEFQEIHKLLKNADDDDGSLPKNTAFSSNLDDPRLECCAIPLNSVVLHIFKEETLFLLFNKDSLNLNKFMKINEAVVNFKQNLVLPEENFRALLAHKALDVSIIEREAYPILGLYIFYLISVHEDLDFVNNCFEFLTIHPFQLCISDIIFIFINFGANIDDLLISNEKIESKKFHFKDGSIEYNSKKPQFPNHNIKMVGQLLLHFVTENLIPFTSETETFVKILVRIVLDSKIRSNSLSTIYSNLLSLICFKIRLDFDVNEIADWVRFEKDNLPIQLEICQAIIKPVVPNLHDIFVVKTIQNIFKCENAFIQTPITFSYIKSILEELKKKKLLPLEIYIILQLINYSLPGLTATKKDFVETNGILAHLDRKISQIEDSVDVIRLKLEIEKIRHLVADLVDNECQMNDSLMASPFK